ncbi:MAG: domain containing protein [Solirubrobacterales bacterium]|nr:domain containing protein [Solirubrobacterales bacterium]
MSYRLTITELAGEGLRRCAAEELDSAREGLADATAVERAKAVHEARKSLKKTRSLVRLARPAIGSKRYRVANTALRDTARTLSGTRDADVLIAVAAGLQEQYVGQLPASAFETLTEHLAAAVQTTATPGAEDPIAQAVQQLAHVRLAVDAWPLHKAGWDTVVEALTTTYANGRADLEAVRKDPAADVRHEWRKRVKDLWYQQRLVVDAWEPVLAAQAEQAHLLSEHLGDDHDLAVLHEAITSGRMDAGSDSEAILALIDQRRDELLHAALTLGDRLYAESPKAFARRVTSYLRAWEAQADDELAA